MSYKTRCETRERDYVVAQYKRIYPKGVSCPMNFKCHWNSLEYAVNKKCKIVSCYVVDFTNTGMYAHFINVDKDGNYIETSVGSTWYYKEYYLVNEHDVKNFNPSLELTRLKELLFNIAYPNKFLNWLKGFTADNRM